MKKIRNFLGLTILIFAGLIVYQNRDYFLAKQAFSLNLGVETWQWTAPGYENLAYYGAMLFIGLFFSGFYGFASKFRSRKIIKSLNATIKSHQEMVDSLKSELRAFTADPYRKAANSKDLEMATTEIEEEPIEIKEKTIEIDLKKTDIELEKTKDDKTEEEKAIQVEPSN